MREILFRGKGKCLEQGKWIYGSFVEDTDLNACCIRDKSLAYELVDRKTVGQYTGLTDKNGNKIFEGDIVEFESHGYIPKKEKGTVIFKDGCFGIDFIPELYRNFSWGKCFHRIGEINKWQEMGASGEITYTYEVIGNIHDNPELLEVEK